MLPQLVPLLMKNMVYSEMDLAMFDTGDDGHVPDLAHQIRPVHYHGRVAGDEVCA